MLRSCFGLPSCSLVTVCSTKAEPTLEDVVTGFYAPAKLSTAAFAQILEINQKHATLELGATDASVIVIAQTLGVSQIAAIDRRHFVPPAQMFELELLP
jgi:uncharacterized protein